MRVTLPVLSDARKIATREYPLRASALPKIDQCPASVFLSQALWLPGDDDDPGGEAAQTGNLVHSAAKTFHDLSMLPPEERREAGLKALEAAREKFPGGDPKKAKKHFLAYASDPQNSEAKVVKVEQKVWAEIPPSPLDPTGEPVVIRGTLDQLRIRDGIAVVDDIKTGSHYYGLKALDHYRTQQAAYVLAARQTFGKEFGDIEPGALICTDGYFRPEGRVFWYHKWSADLIPMILQNVVNQVAAARAKLLGFSPSIETCRWCEHKNFENCSTFARDHIR